MNICHLATKGFSDDISVRRSIVYNGTPLTVGVTHTKKKETFDEETVSFNKFLPDEVNAVKSLGSGRQILIESPLGSVICNKNSNINALSSIFDYKVKPTDDFAKAGIPIGVDFESLLADENILEFLGDVAEEMFPNENPNTGYQDVDASRYYTPYIPLVTITGCIPPQVKGNQAYFNPEGVVTVAEFLDGLNSIKYGCNSNRVRKKTLDNISKETDYFNEGYQSCIRGISSPFFNLYTRDELLKPITRLELAYITVICWTQFIEKYNNLYGGSYYLGVNFDWELPSEILEQYDDGFNYKISKISIDDEHNVISLNVKDYKSDRSMSEYKEDIKSGVAPIPLPMFMSMLELGVLGAFNYEGNRLDPLKEVSRGEFCYFLVQIARLFPTRYIN